MSISPTFRFDKWVFVLDENSLHIRNKKDANERHEIAYKNIQMNMKEHRPWLWSWFWFGMFFLLVSFIIFRAFFMPAPGVIIWKWLFLLVPCLLNGVFFTLFCCPQVTEMTLHNKRSGEDLYFEFKNRAAALKPLIDILGERMDLEEETAEAPRPDNPRRF